MDRREAFERAIPLVPGRTALLVVDMQRAFLEPGEAMEVPPARDIVPRIGELIAIFRDKGLPVVFTRFTYSADGAAPRRRAPPRAPARRPRRPRRLGRPSSSCLEGQDNVGIVPDLEPRAGRARHRQALLRRLQRHRARRRPPRAGHHDLVVTGTMTDICVLATVVGGFNREYRMVVVEDGVATLWPGDPARRARHHWAAPTRARARSAKDVADQLAGW